jgi:hypothetical protein
MPSKFTEDNALQVENTISRDTALIVREAITENDANVAAVYALNSGADCTGYDVIEVEVDMTGSEGDDRFIITPLAKAEGAESYSQLLDQQRVVVFSEADMRKFRVTVGGNADVNFLCNGSSGVSPTIASIKAIPIRSH